MVDTYNRLLGATATTCIKTSCRGATTGTNLFLSGYQTIDGVAFNETSEAAGLSMRILVKDQTDATQNGIYLVNSGLWTRVPDFGGNNDFVTGSFVYVTGGAINGGRLFAVTSTDPQSVGVNTISFARVPPSQIYSRADIANYVLPGSRVIALDGSAWVPGTFSGPLAIQDASGAWWQIDTSRGVWIDWFGAVMDGVTDDTAAIQAALNSGTTLVLCSPGRTSRCASGIYIPSNVTLQAWGFIAGSGKGQTLGAFTLMFDATVPTSVHVGVL